MASKLIYQMLCKLLSWRPRGAGPLFDDPFGHVQASAATKRAGRCLSTRPFGVTSRCWHTASTRLCLPSHARRRGAYPPVRHGQLGAGIVAIPVAEAGTGDLVVICIRAQLSPFPRRQSRTPRAELSADRLGRGDVEHQRQREPRRGPCGQLHDA